MKDKNYHILTTMFQKQSYLFCQKYLFPIDQAWVFIEKNFHSGHRDLSCKNQDLSNQGNPASHMNTLKLLPRKERQGEVSKNQASTHMKRPLAADTKCTLFEECQKSHVKLAVGIQNLPHQHLVQSQCFPLTGVFYIANSLCSLEVFNSSVQLVIFKCENGLLVDRKCCRDINYLLY